MRIVGSDFVAVTCIVAGGVLGGLGWNALGATQAPSWPDAPPASSCSGVAITAVPTPGVIVRIVDRERVVLASRAPAASNLQIACGEVTATADELRSRTRKARLRVIDLRQELQGPKAPEVHLPQVPEPRR